MDHDATECKGLVPRAPKLRRGCLLPVSQTDDPIETRWVRCEACRSEHVSLLNEPVPSHCPNCGSEWARIISTTQVIDLRQSPATDSIGGAD